MRAASKEGGVRVASMRNGWNLPASQTLLLKLLYKWFRQVRGPAVT